MDGSLFAWIITGLVLGVLAQFVLPGRDPGGFIVTILIGIAGALLGGILVRVFAPAAGARDGLIAAAAGAILLLAGYRLLIRRRAG